MSLLFNTLSRFAIAFLPRSKHLLISWWTPHLLEFAQVYVHWIGDTIQPSHPPLPSSPSAFNLSQHQGLFQWVSCSHQVAKVLELWHQSFQSIQAPMEQSHPQGFDSVGVGEAPVPILSTSTPGWFWYTTRYRTSALGTVVPGRFFCFDGSDPKLVGRGRSEVCFEEKLSWLLYSKGNASCSRKMAGGHLNCLSCWYEDRFLSACLSRLIVQYLGTGGPHKEDYGLQHQLVNKSCSPAGSLPS